MKPTLFYNISELITLEKAQFKDGRNLKLEDLSSVKNAAIVANKDEILWVGESKNLPCDFQYLIEVDCRDFTILPEVADAHTHLVFAGNRAHEYTLRLNGASYEEIAKAGGGILHTTTKTNELSKDDLKDIAKKRIEKMVQQGTSIIEIKSGYGLNYKKEKELSFIIHELKQEFSPHILIKNTYMAAHAIPKEFKTSQDYINQVVVPLLEELAPLNIIDAVDIFHEQNYFSSDDCKILFNKALELNIKIKSHADELNDNSGATLASQYGALSCDHLLKINDEGINALAKSSTVACLLPGTGFFLGKPQAPARKLLDHGVKVAIASDFNPGSCHYDNVFKIAQMVAPTYKMNACELLAAITINASSALDLKPNIIIKGNKSRFGIYKAKSYEEIIYNWSENLFFKHSFEMINE